MRQRLDRSDREARALSRISGQAASGAAIKGAYQCFVDEIKGLVDFHRFTFFLVHRKAGLLTSAGWHRVVRFQLPPNQSLVLVDQTRITQALVYLLRCAASSSPEEAELLVRVSNRGDRVEVTIGAREKNVGQTGGAESTVGITSGIGNFPLNPPVDPMDDALRLSVCRTVEAAHGAELEVGIPGEWERMFSFKLPVFTTDL